VDANGLFVYAASTPPDEDHDFSPMVFRAGEDELGVKRVVVGDSSGITGRIVDEFQVSAIDLQLFSPDRASLGGDEELFLTGLLGSISIKYDDGSINMSTAADINIESDVGTIYLD